MKQRSVLVGAALVLLVASVGCLDWSSALPNGYAVFSMGAGRIAIIQLEPKKFVVRPNVVELAVVDDMILGRSVNVDSVDEPVRVSSTAGYFFIDTKRRVVLVELSADQLSELLATRGISEMPRLWEPIGINALLGRF